jgi:excinuclease UvrABC helicase subunit UvrB
MNSGLDKLKSFQVECKNPAQILKIFKYYYNIKKYRIVLFSDGMYGLNTLDKTTQWYFENNCNFIIVYNDQKEVSGHKEWREKHKCINFNDLFKKREKFDSNEKPRWE